VNTSHGAPTGAARSSLDQAQGSRARFAIHIDAPRQDLDKLPARSSFAAPIGKQSSFQQRKTLWHYILGCGCITAKAEVWPEKPEKSRFQ
jgi:hypothetical protein